MRIIEDKLRILKQAKNILEMENKEKERQEIMKEIKITKS